VYVLPHPVPSSPVGNRMLLRGIPVEVSASCFMDATLLRCGRGRHKAVTLYTHHQNDVTSTSFVINKTVIIKLSAIAIPAWTFVSAKQNNLLPPRQGTRSKESDVYRWKVADGFART